MYRLYRSRSLMLQCLRAISFWFRTHIVCSFLHIFQYYCLGYNFGDSFITEFVFTSLDLLLHLGVPDLFQLVDGGTAAAGAAGAADAAVEDGDEGDSEAEYTGADIMCQA